MRALVLAVAFAAAALCQGCIIAPEHGRPGWHEPYHRGWR